VTLAFEVYAALIRQALDVYQNIDFIFHGGEPLLLGTDFFSKIVCIQSLGMSDSASIRNLVQTNGSLIDAEWCEFLRENAFHVGISLDGPETLHNANRVFPNGTMTFSAVMKGVCTLIDNDVDRYGFLSVASTAILSCDPSDVFRFFAEHLHVDAIEPPNYREVSLLAERPAAMTFRNVKAAKTFYETRQRYAEFLCRIYDLWIDADDPRMRVREIGNKIDCLVGGGTRVCAESGNCVGTYFGIDSDGNVAHCDTFFHDPRFAFGNLREEALTDILTSKKLRQAAEYEQELRGHCRSCRWFSVCRGGCLYEAILFANSGLENRQRYCHNRIIYDHICNDLGKYVKEIATSSAS
jgi:uncharacterized protein